jgi:predicted  nucleic acid-binding Zn-ribbon protein
MKYVPFKWLVVCIVLPAAFYGLSVQGLESYLTHRYTREIHQIYIGDVTPLLDGSRDLRDTVRENIERFLRTRALPPWVAKIHVLVTTKRGTLLYPATFPNLDTPVIPRDNMAVASKNFALMNEGLELTVEVNVGFASPLALGILALFILLSGSLLYRPYRSGIEKARDEEYEREREVRDLRTQEKELADRLQAIERERESISVELKRMKAALQTQKAKATQSETEMFDEIVALDSKLKDKDVQQQQQVAEIEELREQIATYEAELKKEHRQRTREVELNARRLKAVYKNIEVVERAVEGFVALPDDMRIKAEEVIHRLNDEPDQVTIKRKVFSKKGRETVLEVLFSYNGRLYFRRTRGQEVEILAIGTKNTQSKDLEYINNVTRKT